MTPGQEWDEFGQPIHVSYPKPQEPASADPIIMVWLTPLTIILAAGFYLILINYWEPILKFTLGSILVIPFIWLLISSFRTAMPERQCPKCQANRLVLINPQNEFGVRCLDCNHQDPEKRIPYMKDLMNDPEIAREAGFVLDEFGQAHLPRTNQS